TSLRAQGARSGIRAGAAGLADRVGDERVDHALVPLAHPAADRARLFLAARAHAQGRRRGRALDRGGFVLAPVCWLMGRPWTEAATAGRLMGIKTILNEFIAYVELSKLPPDALDPRARLIMLYAMCGFANFGSLGIMIAGLATMAPDRRDDVLSLSV